MTKNKNWIWKARLECFLAYEPHFVCDFEYKCAYFSKNLYTIHVVSQIQCYKDSSSNGKAGMCV